MNWCAFLDGDRRAGVSKGVRDGSPCCLLIRFLRRDHGFFDCLLHCSLPAADGVVPAMADEADDDLPSNGRRSAVPFPAPLRENSLVCQCCNKQQVFRLMVRASVSVRTP